MASDLAVLTYGSGSGFIYCVNFEENKGSGSGSGWGSGSGADNSGESYGKGKGSGDGTPDGYGSGSGYGAGRYEPTDYSSEVEVYIPDYGSEIEGNEPRLR